MTYKMTESGFFEIPHTADLCIKIWAPDFQQLLICAATGMYQLAGVELKQDERRSFSFSIEGEDLEFLLVGFLNELLFIGEENQVGFDSYSIQFYPKNDGTFILEGVIEGAPILSQEKEIKAATYAQLAIHEEKDHLETLLIFDV
jgi:SHS2 domain-containing protein